jgi:hypothetical protein
MANEPIDYLNRDIVNVKTELNTLSKIVRDGNGQPSLIQQVANLSNRVENVELNLQTEMQELREAVETFHQYTTEKSTTTWQVKAAIVVALITSFTSIIINWQDKHEANIQQEISHEHVDLLNKKLDKLLDQRAELKK